jgi:putative Ca2+/H+ antiporter (TMEM165/GDT1 family)
VSFILISHNVIFVREFFIAYITVFVAEVAGDKLMLTTAILATRYRMKPLITGTFAAFAIKMAVAVTFGRVILLLPRFLVVLLTLTSFATIAISLWVGESPSHDLPVDNSRTRTEALFVSFLSVLCSEWGDVGQLTTATLAVELQAPAIVWTAAVSAMMTKAAASAVVVSRFPSLYIPRVQLAVRTASVGVLIVIAALSVMEIFARP